MATTMRAIMVAVENAILGATPPQPADLPYRRAPGVAPLEEQEHKGSQTTREFAVESMAISGIGDFVGPCYEIVGAFRVVVRYAVDKRNKEQWRDTMHMAASDAGRIIHTIMRPGLAATWSTGGALNFQLTGHENLRPAEVDGVWLQAIEFTTLFADDSALP